MDIRQITGTYAVAPQIEPTDMAAIAAAGFKTVINNRPDAEVPFLQQDTAMRAAAETAGLRYVANPVVNGALTLDMVTTQGSALADSDGPVLAWCRSGTRSSIVWALSQAGKIPTDEIVSSLARAGYQLPGIDQQIDALAQQSG